MHRLRARGLDQEAMSRIVRHITPERSVSAVNIACLSIRPLPRHGAEDLDPLFGHPSRCREAVTLDRSHQGKLIVADSGRSPKGRSRGKEHTARFAKGRWAPRIGEVSLYASDMLQCACPD